MVHLAGSLTARSRLALAQLDVRRWENPAPAHTPGLLVMDMDSTAIQTNVLMKLPNWPERAEGWRRVTERAMARRTRFTATWQPRGDVKALTRTFCSRCVKICR